MLSVRGSAAGPAAVLSSRTLAFGYVRAGMTATQPLTLRNSTDEPAAYEFVSGGGAGFAVTPARGVVPPNGTALLTVSFHAARPGNHWVRAVMLLHDAEQALSVDLLASCFDDNVRPPMLQPAHIAAHLASAAAREDPWGPMAAAAAATAAVAAAKSATNVVQPLSAIVSAGSGSSVQAETQLLVGSDGWQMLFSGLFSAVTKTQGSLAAAAELLLPPLQPPVSLSDALLEFGSCTRLSPAEPRSLSVHNNTASRLLVTLLAPPWNDPLAAPGDSTGAAVPVFQVRVVLLAACSVHVHEYLAVCITQPHTLPTTCPRTHP